MEKSYTEFLVYSSASKNSYMAMLLPQKLVICELG